MISIYNLKPKFQALLLPILTSLHRRGVSANMITVAAILLSFTTGLLVLWYPSFWALILVPISLLIRMALNALDGMMARTYNMQSKLGEVLNEVGDVISDFVMFYPLAVLFQLKHPTWFVVFLMLSILNEFSGILGKAVSGVRRYDGPMGKSDRALVVGLSCIFLLLFPDNKWVIDYVVLVMILLLSLSTCIRLYKTIKVS